MSNLLRTIGALAVGGMIIIPVLASARSPVIVTAPRTDSEVPNRHIAYADLNLARHEDQKILNLRIDIAIGNVCSDSGWQANEKGFGQCRDHAWKGARPQVANAIQRATEIVATGHSALPAVAIAIVAY